LRQIYNTHFHKPYFKTSNNLCFNLINSVIPFSVME
jgi:hypothetical protein